MLTCLEDVTKTLGLGGSDSPGVFGLEHMGTCIRPSIYVVVEFLGLSSRYLQARLLLQPR
jgi:hypothetical protein